MTAPRDQTKIGLVVTGGTIGSEVAGEKVHLRTEKGHLSPELGFIFADEKPRLQVVQPLRKLSENMIPPDWVSIASTVVDLVENVAVSGVIVLHGTDTAAYTAAALAFLTADIEVPIVLTGSNLPASEPNSDAPTNVRDAMVAVTCLGYGTYLSFSGIPGEPSQVYLGTDVRKTASANEAFSPVKGQPIASIVNGRFTQQRARLSIPRSTGYVRQVDDRVLGITLYPGINLQLLADAVIQRKMRGVVVELYPTGTGPTVQGASSLSDFIRRCEKYGIVVVTTSSKLPHDQAKVYETLIGIRESGALFNNYLIFETAVTKLMWALAQSSSTNRVKELMRKPIGEDYTNSATDSGICQD